LEPDHKKAFEIFARLAKDEPTEDSGYYSFGNPKRLVPLLKGFLEDKEAKRRTEALKSVLLLGKQAKALVLCHT
jgi:hypothetical protein